MKTPRSRVKRKAPSPPAGPFPAAPVSVACVDRRGRVVEHPHTWHIDYVRALDTQERARWWRVLYIPQPDRTTLRVVTDVTDAVQGAALRALMTPEHRPLATPPDAVRAVAPLLAGWGELGLCRAFEWPAEKAAHVVARLIHGA